MSAIKQLQKIQTILKNAGLYHGVIDGDVGPLTEKAWDDLKDLADEERIALRISVTPVVVNGKMSTFGGPKDFGVTPSEGLWCFPEEKVMPGFERLFLPVQPTGTTGLARRLNPEEYYIAMRYFGNRYAGVPQRIAARNAKYAVEANGKTVVCTPVDWGPSEWTNRVCDISPGAAKALGVDTDDAVNVRLIL